VWTAGVDGLSIEAVECQGVDGFRHAMADDLKGGSYQPQPVRRGYIPKPDGRQRPLGMPTVRDRVVQHACKLVIEPLFEANFQDHSYGFRPKRRAAQTVNRIKEHLVGGWDVVDADIEAYFDTIDHEVLMSLVTRRMSNRKVLRKPVWQSPTENPPTHEQWLRPPGWHVCLGRLVFDRVYTAVLGLSNGYPGWLWTVFPGAVAGGD
jgi:retron-type reverse transcriptase